MSQPCQQPCQHIFSLHKIASCLPSEEQLGFCYPQINEAEVCDIFKNETEHACGVWVPTQLWVCDCLLSAPK